MLERRTLGQLRRQSQRAGRPQPARAARHRRRRQGPGRARSATPATARPWAASSTRSAPSGPAMPATRSSGNSPARPRWRSSAAGPMPTPSRGATSTTPSSTGSPPRREVDAARQVGPHPPARPDRRPASQDRAAPGTTPGPRHARTSEPSSPVPKGSSPGRLIERLDRGESLATHVPYSVANLVLRRRSGHGLSRRRGRRRLRPAPQVGDRPASALGRRLQQRRPLLHPVPAFLG